MFLKDSMFVTRLKPKVYTFVCKYYFIIICFRQLATKYNKMEKELLFLLDKSNKHEIKLKIKK